MSLLHEKIKDFKQYSYERHKNLFSELGSGQAPHTLFISCCDSRVLPSFITNSLPGELFIVRNIANIVPPYFTKGEYSSTIAAIEYAVLVLKVQNIVVCGHSNCGGCSSLLKSEQDLSLLPNVRKWLSLSANTKAKFFESLDADIRMPYHIEMINVVMQLENLMTYPFIEKQVKEKSLNIYGWYYLIDKGDIFDYNPAVKYFEPVI